MKNNLQGINSRVDEAKNQIAIWNIRKQETPNLNSKKKKNTKTWPRQAICGKAIGNSLGRLEFLWCRASQDHQDRATSDSQVDGISNMASHFTYTTILTRSHELRKSPVNSKYV